MQAADAMAFPTSLVGQRTKSNSSESEELAQSGDEVVSPNYKVIEAGDDIQMILSEQAVENPAEVSLPDDFKAKLNFIKQIVGNADANFSGSLLFDNLTTSEIIQLNRLGYSVHSNEAGQLLVTGTKYDLEKLPEGFQAGLVPNKVEKLKHMTWARNLAARVHALGEAEYKDEERTSLRAAVINIADYEKRLLRFSISTAIPLIGKLTEKSRLMSQYGHYQKFGIGNFVWDSHTERKIIEENGIKKYIEQKHDLSDSNDPGVVSMQMELCKRAGVPFTGERKAVFNEATQNYEFVKNSRWDRVKSILSDKRMMTEIAYTGARTGAYFGVVLSQTAQTVGQLASPAMQKIAENSVVSQLANSNLVFNIVDATLAPAYSVIRAVKERSLNSFAAIIPAALATIPGFVIAQKLSMAGFENAMEHGANPLARWFERAVPRMTVRGAFSGMGYASMMFFGNRYINLAENEAERSYRSAKVMNFMLQYSAWCSTLNVFNRAMNELGNYDKFTGGSAKDITQKVMMDKKIELLASERGISKSEAERLLVEEMMKSNSEIHPNQQLQTSPYEMASSVTNQEQINASQSSNGYGGARGVSAIDVEIPAETIIGAVNNVKQNTNTRGPGTFFNRMTEVIKGNGGNPEMPGRSGGVNINFTDKDWLDGGKERQAAIPVAEGLIQEMRSDPDKFIADYNLSGQVSAAQLQNQTTQESIALAMSARVIQGHSDSSLYDDLIKTAPDASQVDKILAGFREDLRLGADNKILEEPINLNLQKSSTGELIAGSNRYTGAIGKFSYSSSITPVSTTGSSPISPPVTAGRGEMREFSDSIRGTSGEKIYFEQGIGGDFSYPMGSNRILQNSELAFNAKGEAIGYVQGNVLINFGTIPQSYSGSWESRAYHTSADGKEFYFYNGRLAFITDKPLTSLEDLEKGSVKVLFRGSETTTGNYLDGVRRNLNPLEAVRTITTSTPDTTGGRGEPPPPLISLDFEEVMKGTVRPTVDNLIAQDDRGNKYTFILGDNPATSSVETDFIAGIETGGKTYDFANEVDGIKVFRNGMDLLAFSGTNGTVTEAKLFQTTDMVPIIQIGDKYYKDDFSPVAFAYHGTDGVVYIKYNDSFLGIDSSGTITEKGNINNQLTLYSAGLWFNPTSSAIEPLKTIEILDVASVQTQTGTSFTNTNGTTFSIGANAEILAFNEGEAKIVGYQDYNKNNFLFTQLEGVTVLKGNISGSEVILAGDTLFDSSFNSSNIMTVDGYVNVGYINGVAYFSNNTSDKASNSIPIGISITTVSPGFIQDIKSVNKLMVFDTAGQNPFIANFLGVNNLEGKDLYVSDQKIYIPGSNQPWGVSDSIEQTDANGDFININYVLNNQGDALIVLPGSVVGEGNQTVSALVFTTGDGEAIAEINGHRITFRIDKTGGTPVLSVSEVLNPEEVAAVATLTGQPLEQPTEPATLEPTAVTPTATTPTPSATNPVATVVAQSIPFLSSSSNAALNELLPLNFSNVQGKDNIFKVENLPGAIDYSMANAANENSTYCVPVAMHFLTGKSIDDIETAVREGIPSGTFTTSFVRDNTKGDTGDLQLFGTNFIYQSVTKESLDTTINNLLLLNRRNFALSIPQTDSSLAGHMMFVTVNDDNTVTIIESVPGSFIPGVQNGGTYVSNFSSVTEFENSIKSRFSQDELDLLYVANVPTQTLPGNSQFMLDQPPRLDIRVVLQNGVDVDMHDAEGNQIRIMSNGAAYTINKDGSATFTGTLFDNAAGQEIGELKLIKLNSETNVYIDGGGKRYIERTFNGISYIERENREIGGIFTISEGRTIQADGSINHKDNLIAINNLIYDLDNGQVLEYRSVGDNTLAIKNGQIYFGVSPVNMPLEVFNNIQNLKLHDGEGAFYVYENGNKLVVLNGSFNIQDAFKITGKAYKGNNVEIVTEYGGGAYVIDSNGKVLKVDPQDYESLGIGFDQDENLILIQPVETPAEVTPESTVEPVTPTQAASELTASGSFDYDIAQKIDHTFNGQEVYQMPDNKVYLADGTYVGELIRGTSKDWSFDDFIHTPSDTYIHENGQVFSHKVVDGTDYLMALDSKEPQNIFIYEDGDFVTYGYSNKEANIIFLNDDTAYTFDTEEPLEVKKAGGEPFIINNGKVYRRVWETNFTPEQFNNDFREIDFYFMSKDGRIFSSDILKYYVYEGQVYNLRDETLQETVINLSDNEDTAVSEQFAFIKGKSVYILSKSEDEKNNVVEWIDVEEVEALEEYGLSVKMNGDNYELTTLEAQVPSGTEEAVLPVAPTEITPQPSVTATAEEVTPVATTPVPPTATAEPTEIPTEAVIQPTIPAATSVAQAPTPEVDVQAGVVDVQDNVEKESGGSVLPYAAAGVAGALGLGGAAFGARELNKRRQNKGSRLKPKGKSAAGASDLTSKIFGDINNNNL